MQHLPTIAVIGGTGKSGSYLVRELLKQRYRLRLLHRHPETTGLRHPLLELVKGDARQPEAVIQLLQGCSAVISTLGQPKGEPPIFSQATHNVLTAMRILDIHRYIITTGLSVTTPQDHKSEWVLAATDWMYQHYPDTTADKQAEYELLQQSTVLWTMVRLPLIVFLHNPKEVVISREDCPGRQIHATALATFLVQQLQEKDYHRCAPFLASSS